MFSARKTVKESQREARPALVKRSDLVLAVVEELELFEAGVAALSVAVADSELDFVLLAPEDCVSAGFSVTAGVAAAPVGGVVLASVEAAGVAVVLVEVFAAG